MRQPCLKVRSGLQLKRKKTENNVLPVRLTLFSKLLVAASIQLVAQGLSLAAK